MWENRPRNVLKHWRRWAPVCSSRDLTLLTLPLTVGIEMTLRESLNRDAGTLPCVHRSEKNTSGQGCFPRDKFVQHCNWQYLYLITASVSWRCKTAFPLPSDSQMSGLSAALFRLSRGAAVSNKLVLQGALCMNTPGSYPENTLRENSRDTLDDSLSTSEPPNWM